MGPFIIREAVPADAPGMIEFMDRLTSDPEADIILEPGEFNMTVEQEQEFVRRMAVADNCLCLVAEADGGVVGVLTCQGGRRRAVRHCTELGVSVDREWRNRGIGTALLQRAVDWARASEVVRRMQLYVFVRNEAAIRLYRKMGFEIEGRREAPVYRGGRYLDDYVMALVV